MGGGGEKERKGKGRGKRREEGRNGRQEERRRNRKRRKNKRREKKRKRTQRGNRDEILERSTGDFKIQINKHCDLEGGGLEGGRNTQRDRETKWYDKTNPSRKTTVIVPGSGIRDKVRCLGSLL